MAPASERLSGAGRLKKAVCPKDPPRHKSKWQPRWREALALLPNERAVRTRPERRGDPHRELNDQLVIQGSRGNPVPQVSGAYDQRQPGKLLLRRTAPEVRRSKTCGSKWELVAKSGINGQRLGFARWLNPRSSASTHMGTKSLFF